MINEIFRLVGQLVFAQGNLQAFNKLADQLVQVASSLPDAKFQKCFLNDLYLYKTLNCASSLLELKKTTAASKEI